MNFEIVRDSSVEIVKNESSDSKSTKYVESQVSKLKELIAELYNCCRGRVLYEANEFNLPPTEVKCLMLFEGHKYLSCVEIAGKLEVAKSRVCVILEGLEKKGFVRKTSDSNDGRIKLISLSPVGQRKVKEIDDYIFQLYHQLFEQIPFPLRATVINSLEVLNASMKEMKAKMTA